MGDMALARTVSPKLISFRVNGGAFVAIHKGRKTDKLVRFHDAGGGGDLKTTTSSV